MKCLLISLLTLRGLLQPSAALPQASASASADNPNLESDARAKNMKSCTLFDPPDRDTSIMQCQDICGDAVAKSVAAGDTSSISCIAFGDIQWQTFSGAYRSPPLKCEHICGAMPTNSLQPKTLANDSFYQDTLRLQGQIAHATTRSSTNLRRINMSALPIIAEVLRS